MEAGQGRVGREAGGGVSPRFFVYERSPWSVFQGLFCVEAVQWRGENLTEGSVGGFSPPKKGILCFDTNAAACARARSDCRFA